MGGASNLAPGMARWPGSRARSGGALVEMQRFTEAQTLLEASQPALRQAYGPADSRTQDGLRRLIRLWERREHPEKAAPYRRLLSEPATAETS